MPLSTKEVEDLLQSALMLDCLEIILTQQSSTSPKTYRGPGSIFQDRTGELQLKLYHTYSTNEDINNEVSSTLGSNEFIPGKIIRDQHYYALTAIDIKGRIWTEDRILLYGTLSFPGNGYVIECSLQKITTSELSSQKHNKKRFLSLYISGKYNFPFNKYEKFEHRTSLTLCQIEPFDKPCTIKSRSLHIEVFAEIPEYAEQETYANIIIEALSIGVGAFLHPCIRELSSGTTTTISIHSKHEKRVLEMLLPPPFPSRTPDEAKNLNEFTEKYLRKITEPYSALFGYWFRVLKGSTGELENRALILTTCIEGIIKEYFEAQGLPDKNFLYQVDEVINTIKKLNIDDRVKNRIISSLSISKNSTPKLALKTISKDHADRWVKLRNKSAHPIKLIENEAKLQDFLDDIHGCLELLYTLVSLYIGYEGELFQYSKDGWPKTALNNGNPNQSATGETIQGSRDLN